MTIAELMRLAQSRLMTLNDRRSTAANFGDTAEIERLDAEITQPEETIQALQSLT